MPGEIAGHAGECVLRAPCEGVFLTERAIGDRIEQNEILGRVAG